MIYCRVHSRVLVEVVQPICAVPLVGHLILIFLGTAIEDSVASKLRYSLCTVIGLTASSGSDIDASSRQTPVCEPGFSVLNGIAEWVDPKDIPFAVLDHQDRVRKAKGKKKKIDECRLSRQGTPNPIPRYGNDEKDGISLKRYCRQILQILGEGACNRSRRSDEQPTQFLLHDLPSEGFHESPWHLRI